VKHKDIYDFIQKGESAYQKPINLEDGWDWSMKEHLRLSFLYLNSQFAEKNENRELRPNKNIILPMLNIQYRTEGFDVKDIELYVFNADFFYKSFLVKKYHEKWALENFIDTFIDDIVESYVTYGGVLVRDTDENRPEVIDLRTLAFCNQTNILEYPFAIKHSFSPAKLRKMESWGQDEAGATIDIETLITLVSKEDKDTIDIYEIHGTLPSEWLGKKKKDKDGKDVQQIQVVAFYKNDKDENVGVTLFRHKEPKLPFKFLSRDKVSNRALGRGGVEELFDAQIWTNYSEIQIMEMLELASKIFYKTTDPGFKTRNNLSNKKTGEVFTLQEGKDISPLDTAPRSMVMFNNALDRWEQHAQRIGAASEGMLGETPASGTPFKLFEAQNIEAKSMHKYRQGKIAVFMDEIYRDWILTHIKNEILNEQDFLSELSADEMQNVMEAVVSRKAFEFQKEKVLNGEMIQEGEVEQRKESVKTQFLKGGNKKFIKILKDEMKDVKLDVMTNIAGKQKNLALMTDKLVNVLRQFISTPQLRQDPEMIKILNVILESSGMSPIMFGASPVALPQGGSTEPLKALAKEPALV